MRLENTLLDNGIYEDEEDNIMIRASNINRNNNSISDKNAHYFDENSVLQNIGISFQERKDPNKQFDEWIIGSEDLECRIVDTQKFANFVDALSSVALSNKQIDFFRYIVQSFIRKIAYIPDNEEEYNNAVLDMVLVKKALFSLCDIYVFDDEKKQLTVTFEAMENQCLREYVILFNNQLLPINASQWLMPATLGWDECPESFDVKRKDALISIQNCIINEHAHTLLDGVLSFRIEKIKQHKLIVDENFPSSLPILWRHQYQELINKYLIDLEHIYKKLNWKS